MKWTASRGNTLGGSFTVRLVATDHETPSLPLIDVTIGRTNRFKESEPRFVDLSPGTYLLDVVAPSDWTVTLEPQSR